jgi:acetyl/propionyl-CoA carboxylase alpha subunit
MGSLDVAAGLGPLTMAARSVVVRDPTGREHRVLLSGDDTATVSEVLFRVRVARDGSLHVEGPRTTVAWAVISGDTRWVFLDGHVFTFEVEEAATPRRRTAGHQGLLTAPMPATVRRVAVGPGDTVHRGDILVVLEAMKMELPVRANADGIVKVVNCREGEMVKAGQELVELESA